MRLTPHDQHRLLLPGLAGTATRAGNAVAAEGESWACLVRQKVEAMRFGSVQIIVHEGRVTQLEATEKTRLPDVVISAPASIKN